MLAKMLDIVFCVAAKYKQIVNVRETEIHSSCHHVDESLKSLYIIAEAEVHAHVLKNPIGLMTAVWGISAASTGI